MEIVKVSISFEKSERKAIVKSVEYKKIEGNVIGQQEIHMQTEDGLSTKECGWFMNDLCYIYKDYFLLAKEQILSGEIKEGTEVTVVYNKNDIIYFYL